jgi:hypothetical protein
MGKNQLIIGPKKLYLLLKKRAIGAVVILKNSGSSSTLAASNIHLRYQQYYRNLKMSSRNLVSCHDLGQLIMPFHYFLKHHLSIKEHTDFHIIRKMPWEP